MKTNNITSVTFGAGVAISASKNKSQKFLYNTVLDMVKEFKLPATFYTHEIKLPRATTELLEKLNKLDIKYENIA